MSSVCVVPFTFSVTVLILGLLTSWGRRRTLLPGSPRLAGLRFFPYIDHRRAAIPQLTSQTYASESSVVNFQAGEADRSTGPYEKRRGVGAGASYLLNYSLASKNLQTFFTALLRRTVSFA